MISIQLEKLVLIYLPYIKFASFQNPEMKAVGFLWNAKAIPDSFYIKSGLRWFTGSSVALFPPALEETAHLAIFTIPKKSTHTVLVLPFTGFYLIIHDKMNRK